MIDHWSEPSFHPFGAEPSLSFSSGSSDRSSHLSILTTTSSTSSALSSTSTSSEHADQPSPSSSDGHSFSSGSKTNAFFASPFAADPPLPPVPHSAPVETTSGSGLDVDVTPRMEFARTPLSKKSLNDSFFSPSWPSAPQPLAEFDRPPVTAPPASATRMPPLSRVFPSRVRYTSVDALPSREGSPQGYHSILLSSPPRSSVGRRILVDLDSVYRAQSGEGSSEGALSPTALNLSIPPPSSSVTDNPIASSSSFPTPVAVSSQQVEELVASPVSMSAPAQLPSLRPGDIVVEPVQVNQDEIMTKSTLQLVLVRTLGQGAFSSVWLARDKSGEVGKLEVVRKSSLKRQQSKRGCLRRSGTGSSRRRKNRASESSEDGNGGSDRVVEGTVPKIPILSESGSDGTLNIKPPSGNMSDKQRAQAGRLVALKMTDRSLCDRDDRTRVSFVREVEVLKHISHPSIVSYIHAFSTVSHHILVLEHVSGGELFDLVSSQDTHARLGEPLLRRVFGELCRAVSWMHAVGLVHRDIKLENILLTRDAFSDPDSPNSLIKLTDFGLSRFIDPTAPLLTTRCGSESYAAPELVTGRPYDGRETDAWACGVVLYALVTRRLPFDAMNPTPDNAAKQVAEGEGKRVRGPRRDERSERRALLMRIAKGEYSWPEQPEATERCPNAPLYGLDLARSQSVKRLVGRLLVRDPRKRAKVAQLWDDAWFAEEGAPLAPILPDNGSSDGVPYGAAASLEGGINNSVTQAWDTRSDGSDEFWDEDDDEEGVLVDEDIGPGSVVRQELTP